MYSRSQNDDITTYRLQAKKVQTASTKQANGLVYRIYSAYTPSAISGNMSQPEAQQNGASRGYRLQRSAYINRRDIPTLGHRGLDFGFDSRVYDAFSTSLAPHGSTGLAIGGGIHGDGIQYGGIENSPNVQSVLRLPSIVISGADDRNVFDNRSSAHSSTSHYGNHNGHAHEERRVESSAHLGVPVLHHSRGSKPKQRKDATATFGKDSLAGSTQRIKRRKSSFVEDPNNLAMKLSLPCRAGCCYCVYAAFLGPVKVFFTRADPPKKGPFLGRIKDGNGRPVIPVSRKSDVRGLVYDPNSHSLHPPARGERPMFQEARPVKKDKEKAMAQTGSRSNYRKDKEPSICKKGGVTLPKQGHNR